MSAQANFDFVGSVPERAVGLHSARAQSAQQNGAVASATLPIRSSVAGEEVMPSGENDSPRARTKSSSAVAGAAHPQNGTQIFSGQVEERDGAIESSEYGSVVGTIEHRRMATVDTNDEPAQTRHFDAAQCRREAHQAPRSGFQAKPTQAERILSLLKFYAGHWVPAYKLADIALQYNARIWELRKSGHVIENKTEEENGQTKSWYRWRAPR